uniref:Uncharacterized protein n=1 Tax=Toxoplasma gondii (strain ATCC 50861 / VEG) TaxID=432359 RepID=A0A0F7V421_TOXGV|nr:TPA: hypothetical protein BN1205_015810 [Toxoplasma gondii VEG]
MWQISHRYRWSFSEVFHSPEPVSYLASSSRSLLSVWARKGCVATLQVEQLPKTTVCRIWQLWRILLVTLRCVVVTKTVSYGIRRFMGKCYCHLMLGQSKPQLLFRGIYKKGKHGVRASGMRGKEVKPCTIWV